MATITVPYKVMARGYRVSGDVRSGLKAVVPYYVAWADAFTFAQQVIGGATVVRAGSGWHVTWTAPYQFPAVSRPLYAQRFDIEPCGANGTSIGATKGLAPGEYWDHAIVRVEFESPSAVQQIGDDPGGANQLDPSNPITACEQSVKMAGKMQTLKAGSYLYQSGNPVIGDFAVPMCDTKLVLKFPRVPFLPYQVLRPYINTVNNAALFGNAKGQLLLEGADTVYTPMADGSYGQAVTLEFAENAIGDWNSIAKPDGTYDLVYKAGASNTDANRIFAYTDFTRIFDGLSFG